MLSRLSISLSLIFSCFLVWRICGHKIRSSLRKRGQASDRVLWSSLAAGLFDSSESPPQARMEMALVAVTSKLKLRGAMVTLHGRDYCRVLTAVGGDQELLHGLSCGALVERKTLYCALLTERGQSLAIDYASLSQWRNHAALKTRGWESYLGVNCGLREGEDIVVAFFDSCPRETLFSQSEKSLIEQLAPWIAAMAEEISLGGTSEFMMPELRDSSILSVQ